MPDDSDDQMIYEAHRDRRHHWSDSVAWWTAPHLAYAKGLDDGARIGRDHAYREIFDGLAEGISVGDACFRDAMDRHIRAIETRAASRAWDSTAAVVRIDDYRGRRAS